MDVGVVWMSRVTALLVAMATITLLVAFVTPWWLHAPTLSGQVGLWTHCIGDHCTALLHMDLYDWLTACQALSITALLTSVLTLGVTLIMVKTSRDCTATTARYGVLATSIVTGVTLAITLLIYYLHYQRMYPLDFYTPSISFFLAMGVGTLFLILAVILTIFSLITRRRHHDPADS